MDTDKNHFQDRPQSRRPIPRQGWQEGLDDRSVLADWITFFDCELGAAS